MLIGAFDCELIVERIVETTASMLASFGSVIAIVISTSFIG